MPTKGRMGSGEGSLQDCYQPEDREEMADKPGWDREGPFEGPCIAGAGP